jgi:c-di-GMP-binding flagellar brake protein YcgR
MVAGYLEKRIDKRATFEEKARYKVLGEDESALNFEYAEAVTRNISRGGVCMVVPHKITEGNVIRVEIPMEQNDKPIKAFCEVQWCRAGESGKYDVGLSFIALKEEDVEHLNSYVSAHAM